MLGIDTSGGTSVALVDAAAGWTQLGVAGSPDPRGHAEVLTPLISEVLDAAGLSAPDLAGIAVGTGPAPFTGLRVGIVTARMLGRAAGVEVWGVPSLDVWARAWFDGEGRAADGAVRVVADARRREVYTARYVRDGDGAVVRTDGPDVVAPDRLTLAEPCVGPATGLYPDALPTVPGAPEEFDAALLARIGAERAAAGDDVALTPLYLRRPDVAPRAPRKRAS
ncbi:peptidase M22 glycoprotease [Beutenbergia cavernae DSM 12333]|uniref:Peptidase M22 glycoprotease n=1 Tax=Beutenbergia cavernae (strain ATCC BAA-8 / DSM 12333 / CCUG 43141 / JCM 11478 / NBRC 16432 / NCIMB 13614 / HKI 0122) TaxID=471853 RepID=C5BZY5_BEUC1|nr:peptidase M22 glycoprotease [Beutenbergia cavernae DSM 12333]